MLLQSDLDYIFRIGFEIIKKYPVKIYGSVDLFNSIFFQGHLRLFLPLPLVCYNKMVKKKIHMHEEWQSRHRSKHEYVIGPFKKYYPTRSCHFFFFKTYSLTFKFGVRFSKIYLLPTSNAVWKYKARYEVTVIRYKEKLFRILFLTNIFQGHQKQPSVAFPI